MDLSKLETFAVEARRELMRCVSDKIAFALREDSPVRRQNPQAVGELEKAIKANGQEAVVERTAYTWFNRFCALRYMDVNGYTDSGVVTPPMGGTIPGILSEARDGNFDEGLFATGTKDRVRNILTGAAREDDPNSAAYRVLFIATCNSWHSKMPFLFERLGDWTEILLPDDLLSANSILAKVRIALTAEACSDVEVIGWLYQFYVSEKKKAIEDGFDKNIKASAENIPAVTQLFTPLWIVKYLVQNSLGRLWLTLHPESALKNIMEYYVPGDIEHPTPVPSGIERPEDLRICDPCCGSAHMLTYAFDILYFIYEECGYSPAEIPALILKYNLFGLELDPRAAALASFALIMKARSRYSRFLKNPTMPNICALQAVKFESSELNGYMDRIGKDLFTLPFATTLHQFEEADNFGSLIVPELESAADIEPIFAAKKIDNDLLCYSTHKKVLCVLRQAAFLAKRYHVVVTNPPYLGSKNMNARLKVYSEEHFGKGRSDLFAMFIDRCTSLCLEKGSVGMITMQSWMFLSSFEELRKRIIRQKTLITLAHLGPHAFDTIGGEVVSTAAFVFSNSIVAGARGSYFRLVDEPNESGKVATFVRALADGSAYYATRYEFEEIPGSPIAYWISQTLCDVFKNYPASDSVIELREGMHTGKNERFLRMWFEVSRSKFVLGARSFEDVQLRGRWVPYNKGGGYRKWYGNNELVIRADRKSLEEMASLSGHVRPSQHLYFKRGATWSAISSNKFALRYYPEGFLFDSKGQVAVGDRSDEILTLFNTSLYQYMADVLMPTLDYKCGDVRKLPYMPVGQDSLERTSKLVSNAKDDWDSAETSWDFSLPSALEVYQQHARPLGEIYSIVRESKIKQCAESKRLEEANNNILIDKFEIEGEVSPLVRWENVTLGSNPWYRYSRKAPETAEFPVDREFEHRMRFDEVCSLISYSVGCMMGRYSLDKPGLILADQGATEADYYAKIGVDKSAAKFTVDEDGIIPILDNDWFADDIVTRFKEFIKVAFGEKHYLENIAWIEDALGKDIRSYFTKDFFKDHLQRYQNRPIYWLFQSPKGAFRALVYMHRYKPDMVGGVLGYLRSLQTKIDNQLDVAMQVGADESKSASERVRANKDAVKYAKAKKELDEYEKNVLYPLSTERIEIDLDDGVKVNYRKFGTALRKVAALEGKGE